MLIQYQLAEPLSSTVTTLSPSQSIYIQSHWVLTGKTWAATAWAWGRNQYKNIKKKSLHMSTQALARMLWEHPYTFPKPLRTSADSIDQNLNTRWPTAWDACFRNLRTHLHDSKHMCTETMNVYIICDINIHIYNNNIYVHAHACLTLHYNF